MSFLPCTLRRRFSLFCGVDYYKVVKINRAINIMLFSCKNNRL
jgi:hypothetical protein